MGAVGLGTEAPRISKTLNITPKPTSPLSLDAAVVGKVVAVISDSEAARVTVINMEPLVLAVLTTTMSSAGIPIRVANSALKLAYC